MKKNSTYYIKTYGCAMNYSDSDRIRNALDEAGMSEVSKPNLADNIILNSCSVRQQSEDKVVGWIEKVETDEYKNKKFILTGCMSVRYDRKTGKKDIEYENKLRKLLPWVSEFIESSDIKGIYKALDVSIESSTNSTSVFNQKVFNSDRWSGNFPISIGCDFFCSYCIVPFSRGDMEHRDYLTIINEVRNFIQKGGKIVTLIGQNVNSWKGLRGSEVITFPQLLVDVCNLEGDFWVNFISSNPMDFSDELSNVVTENSKVMKSLNLAVQSGSNRILTKMNRHYTAERFLEIVSGLRSRCPNFNLSSDIIVGFPSETDEDFQLSLDLVRKANFSMIYIGKYSPRKGTVASKAYKNDISLGVKKEREQVLKKLLDAIKKEGNENWLGKKVRVLVKGAKRGISFYNHEIIFESLLKEEYLGKFVDCEVIATTTSGLMCKVL